MTGSSSWPDNWPPRLGHNQTAISCVRILRTEAVLDDVPVLYRPGAVFVLQGSKQGILEGEVYLYDEDHYLAVSVPVPFRMTSKASQQRPLLAVYLEFDMQMAAEIALQGGRTRRSLRRQTARAAPQAEWIAISKTSCFDC